MKLVNFIKKHKKTVILSLLTIGILLTIVLPSFASDPSGAATGTIVDVPAKVVGEPTLNEIGEAVGKNRIAINMMWVLIAGFLVMLMQVGFALAETGFTRGKNAAHTMLMNFMVYAIGMTGYWIAGFAIHMGGVGGMASLGAGAAALNHEFTINILGKPFGLFGYEGFFLNGSAYDVGIFALFLFQMVFMDTAATIPTGSMAERWKFITFVVYAFILSMLIYPVFANWVWGGGWLSQLGKNFGLGNGFLDFAGSSVVHMVGGVTALAGAIVLGPRIGKFNKDGSPNPIPGHSIPMGITGALILAFGWFGFNAGSTMAGSDLRIAVVATNTMLASAAGALAAMMIVWIKFGKPDASMIVNGFLAGLVAITASCAFVNSQAAFFIGAVGGAILVWGVLFVERVLKVDDPVGAISVHGIAGAWGIVALGLFADGTYGGGFNGITSNVTGLLYGNSSQLFAQLIGIVANVVWVFGTAFATFKILDAVMGLRVTPEEEIEGLDPHEIGLWGYPEQFAPELSPDGALKTKNLA